MLLPKSESNDTLREIAVSQQPSIYKHCRLRTDESFNRQLNHISFRPWFNYIALVLIAGAAVEVGVQIESSRSSTQYKNTRLLHMLLNSYFVLEVLIRLHGLGWEFLAASWNVLDFLVASTCIFDLASFGLYTENVRIRIFVILRVIRIFMLFRTPAIVARYRELWLLIHGFVEGAMILLYVSAVTIFLMYFVACMTTYDVASHSFAIREKAEWSSPHIYFGTTVRAFLTLFQGVTFDRWSTNVARPLAEAGRHFSVGLYIMFIIVVGYGLFKVVIAVFIERCISVSVESENNVKIWRNNTEHDLIEETKTDFDLISKGIGRERNLPGGVGLGEELKQGVSFDEFKAANMGDLKEVLKALRIGNAQVQSIYKIVDIDGTGRITTEQFAKAVLRLRGDARARDLVYISSLIKTSDIKAGLIKADLDLIFSETHQLSESVDHLDKLMHQIAHKYHEVLNSKQRDSVTKAKKVKLIETISNNPRLGVSRIVADKNRRSKTEVNQEYLASLTEGLLEPSSEGMRSSTLINGR